METCVHVKWYAIIQSRDKHSKFRGGHMFILFHDEKLTAELSERSSKKSKCTCMYNMYCFSSSGCVVLYIKSDINL